MNPIRWPTSLAGTLVATALAGLAAPVGAQGASPPSAAPGANTPTATPGASEAELARRLDALAAELARVRAELAELQRQRGAAPVATAPAATAAAASAPPAPVFAAAPEAQARGPGLGVEPATVLTSYGEIVYSRPRDSGNTVADLRRFVLGYQHRFDEKTKVVIELEVEHAVSSADDPGEVEIEQAYLERQLTPRWSARAGLFLIPAGLLNENHEPTAYYGVERNFVETAIIPSTWREGGLQLVGAFDNGVTAQLGLVTGFDLAKWDATSGEGAESPLGAIHQELALARARDLSVFGALNWRGVPGLLLGGSIFTGGASQGQVPTSSRVTLWDLHARYQPGAWDLSGVYSRGTISNTAAFNAPWVGGATLVPKSFDGWYVQAAYRLWSNADYSLAPFVRWEQFNTARSFADLGTGLTPPGGPTRRVATLGANFNIGSGIVLKADLQRFRDNRDADRIDLGLGWSF